MRPATLHTPGYLPYQHTAVTRFDHDGTPRLIRAHEARHLAQRATLHVELPRTVYDAQLAALHAPWTPIARVSSGWPRYARVVRELVETFTPSLFPRPRHD